MISTKLLAAAGEGHGSFFLFIYLKTILQVMAPNSSHFFVLVEVKLNYKIFRQIESIWEEEITDAFEILIGSS